MRIAVSFPLSSIAFAFLGLVAGSVATTDAAAREPRAVANGDVPAHTQVQPDDVAPLKIAVSPIAGYVQKTQAGAPEGFSIDVTKRVAAKLLRQPTFVWTKNVEETLKAVQEGRVDMGVGAISVTAERERTLDFTHAYASSGLGMAVRAQPRSWWGRLGASLTKGRLTIIFGFFLLIVVAGHLVWLAERGKDAFSDRYFPGVFEGMYWAIVTASTVGYGDKAPVKWAGRALAGLVIVISLPMFAIFTAELTSALTTSDLEAGIQSPNDLGDRPVAVVAGTTSAAFASRRGLSVVATSSVEEAVAAVESKQADAAIYDEVPLRSVVLKGAKARKVPVQVAASSFEVTPIAIAVASQSPLLEPTNQALLTLVEAGDLAFLDAKWLNVASR